MDAILFDGLQSSDGSDVFVLGLQEGNRNNVLVGSLSGELVPGREYELFYEDFITGDATSSGFLTLLFIPEPSGS